MRLGSRRRSDERHLAMIARLGMVLYWCGLTVAALCEVFTIIILVMIVIDRAASEAWLAAVFFAVVGGASWLGGRAAKYVLSGI